MLTAVLLVVAAGAAWAYSAITRRHRRRHARDLAETASWPSLHQYIAEHEHPPAPSRWATPKRDRGP